MSNGIYYITTSFVTLHKAQRDVQTVDFKEWGGIPLATNVVLCAPGKYHQKFLNRIKWIPTGVCNQALEFDSDVDADDAFFIRMRTDGGDDYRLFVNKANTHHVGV